MKTVDYADQGVEYMVQPEFKALAEGHAHFKLTKLSATRVNFNVWPGDGVKGELSFVRIPSMEEDQVFGVKVQGRSFRDYIRTSPVKAIVDTTNTSVTFQTEGGFYKLEAIDG